LRLYSFGGYGLALAALALVVFGAYDSYPFQIHRVASPSPCQRAPKNESAKQDFFSSFWVSHGKVLRRKEGG